MNQYQVKTDKPFDKTQDRLRGITNDPNRADDHEYIVHLIKQVVTVSVETVKIVRGLSELDITCNSVLSWRLGRADDRQPEGRMAAISTLATEIDTMVQRFPEDLQVPIRDFTVWMLEELHVSHKDFSELNKTVQRIATLQEKTEEHVNELTVQVEHLAAGQEKLAAAQQRTEERVEQLAIGQEKLAAAQQRTEQELQWMGKSLSDQIAALGSRWGIYNEGTFRSTIYGVLKEIDGVTIKEGYYGDRQVDVVIRDGEHILLEITSRMHAKDIEKLYQSADDYETQEGVRPKLMVATCSVSPRLMQNIMGLPRPIELFSYEGED